MEENTITIDKKAYEKLVRESEQLHVIEKLANGFMTAKLDSIVREIAREDDDVNTL